MAAAVEDRVVAVALDQPAWGPLRVANELAKEGIAKKQYGNFESECQGYCGAQDTFYVAGSRASGGFTSRPHPFYQSLDALSPISTRSLED